MNEETQSFQESEIDIRSYLRVLQKRRWTIAGFFLVVVLSVAVYVFTATPIYQASSRIIIEKENPNIVSIQEVMAVDATGMEYYQTQYKIIESRSVAREVIRRLKLADHPEFKPQPEEGMLAGLKTWYRDTKAFWKQWAKETFQTGTPTAAPSEEDADAGLVNAFLARLQVKPVRQSRVVDILYESKDPVLAARIANEVVKSYIDQNLDTKLNAAKEAVKWLSERMDEERKKVEEAESALLKYKQQHQIITDFSSDSEKITAQKLASLNEQVVDAQAKRVEAETRYQQALALENSPELLDSIPEVLKNELVQNIKKMEVDIYNRMSELSRKYGPNHPQMVAIQTELEELKKQKAKEAKRVLASLRNEYRLAQAREESLKKALEEQKTASLDMNRKAIQYGVLQRQAESSRNIYELLVKRFKETSLTEEMKTGNIRVVDRAEVPKAPVKPRKGLSLLLAAIVGLMGGVGLAFFVEHLDNSIKLPDEVKDDLGLAYLGPIPDFKPEAVVEGVEPELVLVHSPKSTASESFRGIRTAVLFSSADVPPQVLLITSAGPEEGKSLLVANLALTLALAGAKVLVIDCDLRKPRVHKLFGIGREKGLTSVLVGSADLAESIVASAAVPGLDILPCGPIPPNPAEIVGSKKLRNLIDGLKGQYQHILIDSPPVTAVTDALLLSQAVDSTILVIRAGVTPKPIVVNGLEQLRSVNAHVLGAVLNGIKTGKDSYYYYQYYYYYYGEDGERRKGTRRKKRHSGPYK